MLGRTRPRACIQADLLGFACGVWTEVREDMFPYLEEMEGSEASRFLPVYREFWKERGSTKGGSELVIVGERRGGSEGDWELVVPE